MRGEYKGDVHVHDRKYCLILTQQHLFFFPERVRACENVEAAKDMCTYQCDTDLINYASAKGDRTVVLNMDPMFAELSGSAFVVDDDRDNSIAITMADVADRDRLLNAVYTANMLKLEAQHKLEEQEGEVVTGVVDGGQEHRGEDRGPEPVYQTANFFSRVFYWWLTPLIQKGAKKILMMSDIWELPSFFSSHDVGEQFQQNWDRECMSRPENPKLLRALHHTFGRRFYLAGVVKLFSDGFQFAAPLFLRQLIEFSLSFHRAGIPEEPSWKGYMWAGLMFFAMLAYGFLLNFYFRIVQLVGMNVRSALVSAIYRKSLRLSNAARQRRTTGEVVNMMSIDAQKFLELMTYLHMIWSSVLQVIVSIALLIDFIGPSALAGTAVMFLVIYVQKKVGRRIGMLRRRLIRQADQRVREMNEILQGIRLIKYYAWEKHFAEKLLGIREEELKHVKRSMLYRSINGTLMMTVPIVVATLTFSIYAATGNDLEADDIFASLALLNLLRVPVMMFPNVLSALVDAGVALKRLTNFLSDDEVKPVPGIPSGLREGEAIRIENGGFHWEETQEASRGRSVSMQKPSPGSPPRSSWISRAFAAICCCLCIRRNKSKQSDEKPPHPEAAAATTEAGENGDEGAANRSPRSSVEGYIDEVDMLNQTEEQRDLEGEPADPDDIRREDEESAAADAVSVPEVVLEDTQKDDEKTAEKDTQKQGNSSSGKLVDINISVKKGHLVGIFGPIGCGKSSLLSAILGEMEHDAGFLSVDGGVAYCTQQAWIMSGSLRENILFGLPFEEDRYHHAIRVSELGRDIEILPAGDATEIGEKGINLSGGQKQRVQLARAVYRNADVYLLDDPLSAVDAHVGRHIFEECIRTALEGRTRVLVTHQLQYANQMDCIMFMRKGRIIEAGTYEELMDKSRNTEFAKMMRQFIVEHDEKDQAKEEEEQTDTEAVGGEHTGSASTKGERSQSVRTETGANSHAQHWSRAFEIATGKHADSGVIDRSGALIQKEDREIGSVKGTVYKSYCNATGGMFVVSWILVSLFFTQVFRVASDVWLAEWSDDSTGLSTGGNIGVYVAWAVGYVVSQVIRDVSFAYSSVKASRSLHEKAFRRVLRAPMSFFDTTPLGRIINRFSKDIDMIDQMLSASLKMYLGTMSTVIFTVGMIAYAIPIQLAVFAVLFVLYYRVQLFYRQSSRELKRLESISRSPIFAHFSETLGGISTIRAYQDADRFSAVSAQRLDYNNRAYFTLFMSQRWLSVRIETIGAFAVFFVSLFAVIKREDIEPGLVGLSLSYGLAITGVLNWAVRQSAEVESNMSSVERLAHYGDHLVSEYVPVNEGYRPPAEWPKSGTLEFRHIAMRYRDHHPLVLKDVTFTVNGGEKIGIVGRTGAGKSSLTQVLFRMVEPASGEFYIDGVDCLKLGLQDLRSRLSIIPQDPVLFSGTVRENLDPTAVRTDAELWESLERVHLKRDIAALRGGLDAAVTEYGENFSVGQRQLMCLARALLRKSRILVLDEATASVDMETDALIQRTIRDCFKDCTLLTIAHRLNTIVDSDRIIVMDDGRVAEMDTPHNLLSNSRSIFTSMVNETGAANAEQLRKIAAGEDTLY